MNTFTSSDKITEAQYNGVTKFRVLHNTSRVSISITILYANNACQRICIKMIRYQRIIVQSTCIQSVSNGRSTVHALLIWLIIHIIPILMMSLMRCSEIITTNKACIPRSIKTIHLSTYILIHLHTQCTGIIYGRFSLKFQTVLPMTQ